MSTAEIREDFLSFFADKGCRRMASSSLIPDDPSLLLTNAGMNQFKQYYQGSKTMDAIGATTCQKCLRTNDIENIGDSRHLSFFEMLGNFSFGGYSKADAIAWAYEFCTSPEHLGLPPERLYMTVFTDDDEAAQLWEEQGVSPSHISRLGEEDNFWAAGPTGPCGPCSEIYFDQGPAFEGEAPGDDGDRYLEFWNLVFTQYDRQEDGSMPELPHRNIDTGMGLERMAAIMQHVGSNYEGDVLRGLIALGEKLSGAAYLAGNEAADTSLRILADHGRAVTFLIADGVLPSNEGRGYVLRRLLRRAIFHGRLLGIEGAFLGQYVDAVTDVMGGVYPELIEHKALVKGIVSAEETHFTETLEVGRRYLDEALDALKDGETLAGESAFTLHDTYGFPIDLTAEIAEQAGHTVDMARFDALMEEQRSRGRAGAVRDAWSQVGDVWAELSEELPASEFVGYTQERAAGCKVLALVVDGLAVGTVEEGAEVGVVLDRTPFYAEMGGQVADTGSLYSETATLEVNDTQSKGDGLIVHMARLESGTLAVGDTLTAKIHHGRRELIRRNHTATHLLDAALKKVLGEHVNQAGSLVEPTRLRFDFTHFEALSSEELARVEGLVNAEIFAAKSVITQEMSLEEAKATGAVALFGEKYGERVRVVSVGGEEKPFSRELCGGTHARNTSELGFFKIISEGSVGSNARRLEAVTSAGALEYVDERLEVLRAAAQELKCRPTEVDARVANLEAELKEAKRAATEAKVGAGSDAVAAALAGALNLGSYKLATAKLDGVSGKELRDVWDAIRDGAGTDAVACVLAAKTPDGKAALLAAGTQPACDAGFDAGHIISEIAPLVDGRGGGRANMAQAGGAKAAGIDAALKHVRELVGD